MAEKLKKLRSADDVYRQQFLRITVKVRELLGKISK